ncbi:hypothetical protein IE53DRAFT_384685 [Violaceomyces palustris]|uniref:Uncharacterized protein n=1 Tax=Violaceomyces palustris TaxID=1673888 RepID=A0ACD0P4D4_9BASI|nr:hypothetical protein IE53DRAFT_384685 [Violaceomyces palustris]
MGVDDWRKNFNKKLDDFGEDALKKIRNQREVGSSRDRVGLMDRISMAKGENPQWSKDVDRRQAGSDPYEEEGTNITPQRNRVASPGMHRAGIVSKAPPPPPPVRNNPGIPRQVGGGDQAHLHAPPPPPRMNNEDGINNPPPAYPSPLTSGAGGVSHEPHQYAAPSPPAPPTSSRVPSDAQQPGFIEFSKFTQDDKEAFFSLLDEYFESRGFH